MKWFASGIVTGIALGGVSALAQDGCSDTMSSPVPSGSSGTAWDDSTATVWIAGLVSGKINQVDPLTSTVVHTIPSPGVFTSGLAWDGSSLWALQEQHAMIHQLDPLTGAVLHSIPAPSKGLADPNGSGLAWDDDTATLWHADYGKGLLYRLDPADGTVLDSFAAPAGRAAGLGYHGGYLVLADALGLTLNVLDPADGSVVSSCVSPGVNPWGVCVDDAGTSWHVDLFGSTLFGIGLDLPSGGDDPWYESYCEAAPNSTGEPAVMSAEGSPSVEVNDLTLVATGLPQGRATFLFSQRQNERPFGAGTLCVGWPIHRTRMHWVSDGEMRESLDLDSPNRCRRWFSMNPGETWYFQAFYRDRGAWRCSSRVNFSDAIAITLEP